MRRVNADLCSVVLGEKVDLVVIEGMGRSLHTNYEAKFSVSFFLLTLSFGFNQ